MNIAMMRSSSMLEFLCPPYICDSGMCRCAVLGVYSVVVLRVLVLFVHNSLLICGLSSLRILHTQADKECAYARCLIESAAPVRLEIVRITKRRGVAPWTKCIRTCRKRNGMIRRYLLKCTPVAPSMARELQEIVDETDNRPMRVLG